MTLALFILIAVLDFGIGTVIKLRLFEKQLNFEGAAHLRRPDLLYHHGLIANGHTDSADFIGNRYHFSTNSLGFRDREVRDVPLARPAEYRRRLLFIGDSFVEGLGIDWDSTLVGRVASALAADSIEVLNAGVVSYSPVLMERKLRYYLETVGLQVDEVAVVVDVSDALNEVAYAYPGLVHIDHIDRRPAWRVALGLLGSYSIVWVTARSWWHAQATTDGERLDESKSNRAYEYMIQRASWGPLGEQLMAQHLDSIQRLLNRHTLPMSLTIYPWPAMLTGPKDVDSPYESLWRRWAKSRAVPLVNLVPTFYAAVDSAGGEALVKAEFFKDDIHWNRRGTARAATAWLRGWCAVRAAVAPRACARAGVGAAGPPGSSTGPQ